MKKLKILFVLLILVVGLFLGCNVDQQRGFIQNITEKRMMDLDYKKAIVRDSGNPLYTVENLRPLVGRKELAKFIKKHDDIPDVYTPGKKFRANFHMHTTNSDGQMTVKELLDQAQEYAKTLPDGEYMYVAVTDHNTVNGAKEVVKVLEENPNKYTKVKVIPGIEIYTSYNNSKIVDSGVEIHVLTWCINPYDEYLNKEFLKKNPDDKWNRHFPDRDFDLLISTMKHYGIVGVGHPARYTSFMGGKKYDYIKEMFDRYAAAGKSAQPLFTEGYYQSYPYGGTKEHLGDAYEQYLKFINDEAKKRGIIRTGSTDAHGKSIFSKY